jgi:hypothetical protein
LNEQKTLSFFREQKRDICDGSLPDVEQNKWVANDCIYSTFFATMSFAAGLLHGGIVLAGLAGGTALIVDLVLARDPILMARHQDAAAAALIR